MLEFEAGASRYPIIIAEGALCADNFSPHIKNKACIITDANTAPLYGKALSQSLGAPLIILPAGEESKSIKTAAEVFAELARLGMGRSDLIIALGGGVIGDLAGWCAASYLRGIPYVQAPTTLLAQIDSSMGGKVGVNLKEGKNLVGAFYHPLAVISDTLCLNTLPEADFVDGLAEMIKYGFIHDESILKDMEALGGIENLKQHIAPLIVKCCAIKKMVVSADEKDTGLRMTLNFGHTLGHAVEKHLGLSHGRSVALGMVMLTRLAQKKGLVSESVLPRLIALLKTYGLPHDSEGIELAPLLPYIAVDKKNLSGVLNIILTPEAGKSIIYPTDLNFFGGSQ